MKNKKVVAWRELLTNKFFDLLIVITGVTIAFQLNNWKLSSDQESLALFYKQNILTELGNDIKEQEEILLTLKSDRGYTERFLASAKPSPDSLIKVILEVLSLETFTPHQNTYQTLLQGNGMSVFTNRNTPGQITEYYTSYTSIRRFEDVYTNALFKLHEYFSPYCNYESKKITDLSVLGKNQTRNVLIIVLSQLNDGIEAHTEALRKAKALQAHLQ
jgi:hypothetical protein